MICKNCGSVIDDNAWECPHCLIDITPEQHQEAMNAQKQQETGGAAQMQYAPPPQQTQYAPPPQQTQYAPPPQMQQQYGPAPQARPQYAPPPQPMQTQYAPPPQQSMPREIYSRTAPADTFERPSFYQPPETFEEDKAEVPLILGSIFVPFFGIIMGLVNFQKGKKHSGKVYLLIDLLVRGLPVALVVLFYILIFFLAEFFG
ncbi:MAG: hypothetical protein K5695_13750 [Oscillospiraceae bacterium]|nr:hypothetical protein [Oscillospiraceae bacterium]